jgi:hypothetical protein
VSARAITGRRCGAILCGFVALAAPCAEPEYVIRIRDHQFLPAELHIPSGRKVRIVVENQDTVAEEFDSHSLNREKHIPPGSRAILFIGPLEEGRYIFEGENDGVHAGVPLGVVVAE